MCNSPFFWAQGLKQAPAVFSALPQPLLGSQHHTPLGSALPDFVLLLFLCQLSPSCGCRSLPHPQSPSQAGSGCCRTSIYFLQPQLFSPCPFPALPAAPSRVTAAFGVSGTSQSATEGIWCWSKFCGIKQISQTSSCLYKLPLFIFPRQNSRWAQVSKAGHILQEIWNLKDKKQAAQPCCIFGKLNSIF